VLRAALLDLGLQARSVLRAALLDLGLQARSVLRAALMDLGLQARSVLRAALMDLGLQARSVLRAVPPHFNYVSGINPLTPELNPSAQRCLTRIFTGDFAS
jgi:hypothetical protein